MKIISKFKVRDGIYGYKVSDGGLEDILTERGLYQEDVIEELIREGYKYLDYHGNVLTPEGISIKDIIEEPCTADESEIQFMLDYSESSALTEAEASKYFDRNVEIKEIELRQPKVEIKTREELITYLNKFKNARRLHSSLIVDVRPLNSFVAKEALFTVEELANSKEVRGYFDIIASRRKLQSMNDYKELIRFLQEEGVLGSQFSAGDVKNAYLAWGICGLKTSVINIETKVDDNSDIRDREGDSTQYTVKELCLMDKKGNIYYSGGKIDLASVDDFSNEPVRPVLENEYNEMLGSANNWDKEFKTIYCFVKKYNNRSYYELMSADGVTYTVKVDVDSLYIGDNFDTIYYSNFLFIKCVDNTYISLNKIKSGEEEYYREYNLLLSKARDIISNNTVKVPCSGSFELLLKEGLSHKSAVQYTARHLMEDERLKEVIAGGLDLTNAYDIYEQGPPKYITSKYNPMNIEYENLDELIEIMCTTRDDMEERGEGLVVSKNASGKELDEILFRPLDKLEFVKSVKENKITIDNMYRGRISDGRVDLIETAELLNLVVKVSKDKEIVARKFEDILRDIENSEIVDLSYIMRERSAEYIGYLKDKACVNAARALQSVYLTYVTRVFREQSNLPIGNQRHYMFECVVIESRKNSKEEAMIKVISKNLVEAINKCDYDLGELREILNIEAPAIAVKLMFMIASNQVNINSTSDVTVKQVHIEQKVTEEKRVELAVDIPTKYISDLQNGEIIKTKFCTLYDWCMNEMSPNLAFNSYCLNANITPWRVIPKDNVTIKEYNFHLNYVSKNALTKLSNEFQSRIISEQAKVRQIRETYYGNCLYNADVTNGIMDYTEDIIDTVLDIELDETAENYYDRFRLHNSLAKTKGKYLQRMRLKSDVAFREFADIYNEEIVDEDIYQELENPRLAVLSLSEISPRVLESKSNIRVLEDTTGNIIDNFDISKQSYADIVRWSALISGLFRPKAVCLYAAGYMMIMTPNKQLKLNLKELTKTDALKLVGKGICYQLDASKFLFSTNTGYITVEVL